MTYDDAEALNGTDVRLAQWARAEALKAVMSNPTAPKGLREVEAAVNMFAQLIIEGDLPKPKPGTYY